MLRIIDYARLSAHVYHLSKSTLGLSVGPSRNGRGLRGWTYFTDVDPKMHASSNFFAQLYVKFQDGFFPGSLQ